MIRYVALITIFSLSATPELAIAKSRKANSSETKPQDDSVDAELDVSAGEEDGEPETPPTRKKEKGHGFAWVGLGAGSPEVFSLNSGVWFSKWIGLRLSGGPPIPLTLTVPTPSITLSSGAVYKLATSPTNLNVKTAYGPNIALELIGHPGTETFYLFGGGAYRQVSGVATGQAPLYLCLVTTTNCGSGKDASSIATIDAKISGKTESIAIRAGLGWLWNFGPNLGNKSQNTGKRYFADLQLGVYKPVTVKRSFTVTAQANTNFSASAQKAVQAYLDKLIKDFKDDVDAELAAEMQPYDTSVLPIAFFSIGMNL